METNLDYVVIGGGIAGLYANYLLSKKYNGILLEKSNSFGGRVFEMDFHNTHIKLGAGIMATHNKHLLKLLKKLNIKINKFKSNINTLFDYNFDMEQAIKDIKKVFKNNINNIKGLTVKQFLIKFFGNTFTKQFIENCEYQDFVDSDVNYFIKLYDINDMSHTPYDVLIINWIDLVNKLVLSNCKNNSNVIKVKKQNDKYYIYTNNHNYITNKIIFAVTLKPLMKLMKNISNINYNKYIGTVPFVRIYTYHKDGKILRNNQKLEHFNIVSNELQKIITKQQMK